MVTMYGIANCDTIRKARKWLQAQDVDCHFHDYRKDGLSQEMLSGWVNQLGWEMLLNRRGTTWRKLPDTEKEALDERKAVSLMLANPAMIKRPLLDVDGHLEIGFSESNYAALFDGHTSA